MRIPAALVPPWHSATPSYPALLHSSWVAGVSETEQNDGMKKSFAFSALSFSLFGGELWGDDVGEGPGR